MAWNGSNSAEQPANGRGERLARPHQASSTKHGLVAGLIIVALGGAALWFFTRPAPKAPAPKESKKPAAIKEVTPAPAPKAEVSIQQDDVAKPVKPLMRPRIEYCAGKVTTNWVAVSTNKVRRAKKVFGTLTEQLLATLFSLKLGDMPPPMPRIPPREMNNMAAILVSDNPITDDDDERSAAMKETVTRAKQAYKEFIKQGGSADEFLPYYWTEYSNASKQYYDARREVFKLARETPELGEAYRQKVNAVLREKGIKEVEFFKGLQDRVDAVTAAEGDAATQSDKQ